MMRIKVNSIISSILTKRVNTSIKLRKACQAYAIAIGLGIFLCLLMGWLQAYPTLIEKGYSRFFFQLYSYLPKLLLGWIPFSVGDLFYPVALIFLVYLLVQAVLSLLRKAWLLALYRFLKLSFSIILLYLFFYLSWGLNYYRVPLYQQLGLELKGLKQEDYLFVLDKHIQRCNDLRTQFSPTEDGRGRAKKELEDLMKTDVRVQPILSTTQVKAKSPLSSHLVSYFAVSGYFNPFTQEVQVNENMPLPGYPFTVVHELTHQMGIGFEDECNFVAFLKLQDHKDPWYRYAASYETVQYLLRTLAAQDESLYTEYYNRLSAEVKADLKGERDYWKHYTGWINDLFGFLYSGYLQHNNQPEGLERYSMMSRMVVAWELKQIPKP